jgi:hypothetical protein
MFFLGGNFNAILRLSDKKGGLGWFRQIQKDLNDFITDYASIELDLKNGDFIWTNRRRGFSNIAEKFDRFFIVGNWAATNGHV